MTGNACPEAPAAMRANAQSIIGLFEQLRRQGRSPDELRQIRRAYKVAQHLFAGCLHVSGKQYLAHCVGTASGLAELGESIEVVIAGLLHGAYHAADFGPWRVLMALKRRRLQREVGPIVEHCVHRFLLTPWNLDALNRYCTQPASLAALDRRQIVLHLANDLDNLRNRGLHYCFNADERLQRWRQKGPLMITIAEKSGFPQLAAALASALADNLTAPLVPHLRWRIAGNTTVPPLSARRRTTGVITVWIRDRLRSLVRRDRSVAPRAPG